jgi:multidrug transporter EmrE-like cation transporter
MTPRPASRAPLWAAALFCAAFAGMAGALLWKHAAPAHSHTTGEVALFLVPLTMAFLFAAFAARMLDNLVRYAVDGIRAWRGGKAD